MNKEIIKLSKISKKFTEGNKGITVLKNKNLKINKGELVSLTGPLDLANLHYYILWLY